MTSLDSGLLAAVRASPQSTVQPSVELNLGSGVREDGRVSYGYTLLRGKRSNMEDFHHAAFKKDPATSKVVGLFGIFDGHGGPHAADFVKTNLFINLMQHAKFTTDTAKALVDAYEHTDSQYLQEDGKSNHDDGCTAVTAVLVGQKLYIGNVGDSRAVLCRAGQAVPLSVDHKPNTKDERQRIEDAGGVVVWAGTWRVGGVLAVSRAFGDRPLKPYVIPTPYIQEEQLTAADEFFILASDGLWDVITNQDAIQMVKNVPDAQKAARLLAEQAYERGSNDNISCVVVRFNFR